jgi:hypothetical protein
MEWELVVTIFHFHPPLQIFGDCHLKHWLALRRFPVLPPKQIPPVAPAFDGIKAQGLKESASLYEY